jgi:hypothetical protein
MRLLSKSWVHFLSSPTYCCRCISSGGVVSIFVSPKRKEYIVHKKLLCKKSEYFAKALQDGFKEGEENKLYQPDESAGAFDLFVRWIYTGTLSDLNGLNTTAYLELYVMADKMCLTVLKNEVMDRIRVNSSKWSLSADQVEYLYNNTQPNSLLRKLAAHVAAYNIKKFAVLHGTSGNNKAVRGHLVKAVGRNGEFAVDMLFAMDHAFKKVDFNPLADERSYREDEPTVKGETTRDA